MFFFFQSVMFCTKDNNNLQFNYILNNEANLLESFIQMFGMTNTCFRIFSNSEK
jgi:hypothetical protein